MSTTTDLREFEDRLNSRECTQVIRDVVASLKTAAERAGDVSWSAHSAPGRSWGIIGKRGGRVICRLDLKPQAGHVCVCIPGADDGKLNEAGTVHRRKNAPSWVDIRDTRGASLLEPLIAEAFAGVRHFVS